MNLSDSQSNTFKAFYTALWKLNFTVCKRTYSPRRQLKLHQRESIEYHI